MTAATIISSKATTLPSLHILGAGSIGQLWALSLRSQIPSYPVTLILRGEGVVAGEKSYLWKPYSSNHPTTVTVPVQTIHQIQPGAIDTLLVTTKSYQAVDAVQSILLHRPEILSPSSRIILLCNGALSVRDELLPCLMSAKNNHHHTRRRIPLILATTTHGAYREEEVEETVNAGRSSISCLVHAGMGQTFLPEDAADVVPFWNAAGLKGSCTSDMEDLQWKKLAANCVINPLTALFRCTNGDLRMEPAFYELQHELLREVSQVAKKASTTRVSVENNNNNNNNNNSTLDEEMLRQFVQQVMDNTRDNKSSMLQDVLSGRMTEIHHLNDYIVRKGRTLGIDCPANEEMVSRVQELRR